ncbi:dehydrogenase [Frondihabitans sp. PAMC 28766]|uniref:SDR family oxidoreductase n=1 Tax=Frondihabitans sp. PAMC 28766 TaxID=1795630 RepID=UPI00078CC6C9|nr:SDR family oxidoreductase [Frondihabitans sp. PAMC 28766]AMM22155.1 dehydrogenase [Frondihabitans sp. PAMC 28766]
MTTIALVTGANKGIGLETVRQLASQGARVFLGSRDLARGESAAAALRADGLDVTAVALDVADDRSIADAAATIQAATDHLDILVNNAGIYAAGSASATSRATLREVFETNVFGVVAVTNAFLPLLKESTAGRIVNVSSEVASLGVITDPASYMSGMQDLAYQASKGAVNWVTIMFAKELADTSIKVNAAIPGYVSTDLNGHTGYTTAAQGAEASVALATLPDDGPTGTFWGNLTSTDGDEKANGPW